jgi:hypothetical protein
MAAGNSLEQTSATELEVAQTIVQVFPPPPNDAQTHVALQQQDVFLVTIPHSVITTRTAIQTQVKIAGLQEEGIMTIGLRHQTIPVIEAPPLPQTQATDVQRLVVQQGQLQAAPLEVPLAHLEEDKSGLIQ